MTDLNQKLGVFPSLLLGSGFVIVGLTALEQIVNNWWPFDVARLDLLRSTASGAVEAAAILEAANVEIVAAFLATVFIITTGAALPLAYVLNKRFGLSANAHRRQGLAPSFWVTLRQATAVGLWVTVCLWLNMNRTLGPAIALLAAAVLVVFEVLLQVRQQRARVAAD